ncbi:MAG: FtsX-like permease family protein [Lachnospiraceae bacterium]|nr:FtsX-like permease family protein [Lachnospiraceae bacterium]
MVRLIKRKLQNRKCLNGCLLLGITLFIAIAACTPMFKRGSLNKLIQSKFEDYIEGNNEYPVVVQRSASVAAESGVDFDKIIDKIASYEQTWKEYFEISEKETETHVWITGCSGERQYGTELNWVDIACILEMKEHIKILKGSFYEEEGNDQAEKAESQTEAYPCMITERVMDEMGLVEGEQIKLAKYKDEKGNVLTLQVIGIFDEKDNRDIFWHVEADEFKKQVFVSEETMREIVKRFSLREISYDIYMLLDYSEIDSRNIMDLEYYIEQFHEKDNKFRDNFTPLIKEYKADKQFIDIIFWVLELPVFVLLLAFVYMVSGQILSMETVEIAMLRSRGFSKKQIVFMYMCQLAILTGMGIVAGLPLGYLLCRLAASTDAFLLFSTKSTAIYRATPEMLIYAFFAALIVMVFVMLPVIRYSRYSIVEHKSKKAAMQSVNFIEKYLLDVVLLIVSSYLLYNYNRQKSSLAWEVMTGERLDPVVFLNVSVFLLACGLIGLRLIKYMVRLVYYIGRNNWKPHMYASFLQIMRTSGKQKFISVFLIFTIGMGIFDANVAGTINKNNELRTRYDVGADVVAKEHWDVQVYYDTQTREVIHYYEEPDYQRFTGLTKDICNGITRVVRDDNVTVATSKKSLQGCSMMAVHTREFGQVVSLQEGLNEEHWYNYLNALGENGAGVLISRNIAEDFEVKVGDSIQYTRQNTLSGKGKKDAVSCSGIVCGVFDAWPGYEQYSYGYDDEEKWVEQQKYMIVVNYAYEVAAFWDWPYEIWMDLNDKASVSDVREFLAGQEIQTDDVTGADENIREIRDTAMIQITNGLFTLSFLVSIILCTVGFLIYWITSIKQRELLFGIYRAMGMSMREVNKMLLNEQIFSSFLAGALGGVTGLGVTLLFTEIISVVYLPQNHNVRLQIFIDAVDMCRLLFIVLVMIVVCLMVLRYILRKSNIVQAIKMGED